MARRLKFSVVGLPHYTIWHLYEPSVDDIKHMEEMEMEKKAKEAKEKLQLETINKIKAQFDNPSKEWEKEKATLQNLADTASSKGDTASSKGDTKTAVKAGAEKPEDAKVVKAGPDGNGSK
jgi:mannan polymerase II complex ANP1 subunit